MNEQIIRDCMLADRLARGLADYYSRKVRGVHCPDLLPPEERAGIDSRYDQRLQRARRFVQDARARGPRKHGLRGRGRRSTPCFPCSTTR